MRRFGRVLLGVAAGAVAGVVVSVGFVVARARFEDVYLHGPAEALPILLPDVVVLAALGGVLGWRRPRLLGRCLLGAVFGLLLGIALGILAGLPSTDPSWVWAGGIVGGTLGLLLGIMGATAWALRSGWGVGTEYSPVEPGATRAARWAAGILVLVVVASSWAAPEVEPAPVAEFEAIEVPPVDEVESVVFFLGDAGQAAPGASPVLARLAADVEHWSGALPDSSVLVLALGDLIYPTGMADTAVAGRAEDTLRIRAQMEVVGGPLARERGARLVMLPGNHDWGEESGHAGAVHLHLLDEFLRSRRPLGWNVELQPAPGTGGPSVEDVGEHLRVVLLDTAWWLLGERGDEGERFLEAIGQAIDEADGRRIVLAAHHPFESGGPHGALTTFAGLTGARTLFSRSGAMLQDLHSEPYRALRLGLRNVFASLGVPDLFAGGHEHSMQVLEGVDEADPATILVSGSGSKLTAVGDAPGLLIGRAEPGYARMHVLRDGTLLLFLETAPAEHLSCPEEGAERASCVAEGVAAFRTIWSGELPRPEPTP